MLAPNDSANCSNSSTYARYNYTICTKHTERKTYKNVRLTKHTKRTTWQTYALQKNKLYLPRFRIHERYTRRACCLPLLTSSTSSRLWAQLGY
ncbi:unnamed protein product [Sympodiomycopsis kandeliae]